MRKLAPASAVAFVLALALAPPAPAGGIRECGAYDGAHFVQDDQMQGAGVYNITTRAVRCRKAHKLVRRYWNDYGSWCEDDAATCRIGWDFTCRRTRLGEEYFDARCTKAGGRVVRFQYGA